MHFRDMKCAFFLMCIALTLLLLINDIYVCSCYIVLMSQHECIPVGCVPSPAVAIWGWGGPESGVRVSAQRGVYLGDAA